MEKKNRITIFVSVSAVAVSAMALLFGWGVWGTDNEPSTQSISISDSASTGDVSQHIHSGLDETAVSEILRDELVEQDARANQALESAKTERFNRAINRAEEALESEHYGTAIQYFDLALNELPNDDEVVNARQFAVLELNRSKSVLIDQITAYMDDKRYAQAQQALDELYRLDSNDAEIRVIRERVSARIEQIAQEVAQLFSEGMAQNSIGGFLAEKPFYDRALVLNPYNEEILTHYNAGRAEAIQGALDSAEELVVLVPDLADYHIDVIRDLDPQNEALPPLSSLLNISRNIQESRDMLRFRRFTNYTDFSSNLRETAEMYRQVKQTVESNSQFQTLLIELASEDHSYLSRLPFPEEVRADVSSYLRFLEGIKSES